MSNPFRSPAPSPTAPEPENKAITSIPYAEDMRSFVELAKNMPSAAIDADLQAQRRDIVKNYITQHLQYIISNTYSREDRTHYIVVPFLPTELENVTVENKDPGIDRC